MEPGRNAAANDSARDAAARRQPGIRFDGVTVAYGHTVALEDFSLDIEPGEVMALLGPSGSGKTTALRAVAGFVTPLRGRIFLGDSEVTQMPPHRRGIGMVVQQYALFPHMRVEQNVAFGLRAGGAPRGEIARLHRELPDVTILYVTHDQIEALTLADRIAVMNESRLVDVGSAQTLYQQPPSRFTATFVGNANLLAVTVERFDQVRQQAWVRLGPRTLQVAAFSAVHPGETRMLCIRPHALGLDPHAAGANTIEGTVTEVQWRGSAHRLYLDVDGVELCAESRPLRAPPRRGQRVSLHFAPHDATLLATSNGASPGGRHAESLGNEP